jgi:hypothetical protein
MLYLTQAFLCICMERGECNAQNFNIGWYGQVVKLFVRSFSNFHRYYWTKSYEHMPNLNNTSHWNQILWPKTEFEAIVNLLIVKAECHLGSALTWISVHRTHEGRVSPGVCTHMDFCPPYP